MTRFTLPRNLYFGSGAMENLAKLKATKAVIVLGKQSMRKFGFLDRAIGYLESANIEVAIIEDVEPDPSIETVFAGAKTMQDFQPDLIVAMGGGSVIDAAKAMWIFYENPECSLEDVLTPNSVPKLREKATLVAIPSTAGTSSEVTTFTILTDKSTGIKHPIVDYSLTPDMAILDPDLVYTMSKELVAYTGMDALTHAIEALASTDNNDFTEPLAINSIRMIYKYLYAAHNGDRLAQSKMLYAQYQAGMAFSNSYLGIIHSIAHKLGTAFEGLNIPHGCLNAICLPHVIRFNSKVEVTALMYAEIARIVGLKCETTEVAVENLIKSIQDCNNDLDIPSSLQEFGENSIPESEFLEKLDAIATQSLADPCTLTNPRRPSHQEMQEILKSCFYGTQYSL